MSWFHGTLGHIVRDEEKVEFAIDYLRLFNEALIYISTRRWVQYLRSSFLEESLSYSFVNDDQSHFWSFLGSVLKTILISADFLELF